MLLEVSKKKIDEVKKMHLQQNIRTQWSKTSNWSTVKYYLSSNKVSVMYSYFNKDIFTVTLIPDQRPCASVCFPEHNKFTATKCRAESFGKQALRRCFREKSMGSNERQWVAKTAFGKERATHTHTHTHTNDYTVG